MYFFQGSGVRDQGLGFRVVKQPALSREQPGAARSSQEQPGQPALSEGTPELTTLGLGSYLSGRGCARHFDKGRPLRRPWGGGQEPPNYANMCGSLPRIS